MPWQQTAGISQSCLTTSVCGHLGCARQGVAVPRWSSLAPVLHLYIPLCYSQPRGFLAFLGSFVLHIPLGHCTHCPFCQPLHAWWHCPWEAWASTDLAWFWPPHDELSLLPLHPVTPLFQGKLHSTGAHCPVPWTQVSQSVFHWAVVCEMILKTEKGILFSNLINSTH